MKSFFSAAILLIIIFTYQSSLFGFSNRDYAKRKNQLAEISSAILETKQHLTAEERDQNSLLLQLKNSNRAIDSLSKEISSLNKKLILENETIGKLKDTQEAHLKQLDKQHEALARHLLILYKTKTDHSIKTLLNADDLNTINRHMTYQKYFSEAHLSLTQKIKTTLSLLENNLLLITAHEKNLQSLLANKQKQLLHLQTLKKEREHVLTLLTKKRVKDQEHLITLINNQKELQNILSTLGNEFSNLRLQSFTKLTHKLHWPIAGHQVTGFGNLLTFRGQRSNGVVILPDRDTRVHSISSGKVIFANYLRGFGLLIIINHGNGYMSLYGGNHKLFAKAGDSVSSREVIAEIGSRQEQNDRLYFEIRHDGLPVNPANWCV